MSTETTIEVGDRVRHDRDGVEGIVASVTCGRGLIAQPGFTYGMQLYEALVPELRLVAKARYEPVAPPEPAEDPVVAETRGAWRAYYVYKGEPAEIEDCLDPDVWQPVVQHLARSVLALIEDRNQLAAEVARLRAELERRSELPTDEVPSWEAGYAIGQRHEREKQEAEALQLRNRLEFVVADQEQLIEAQERDVAQLAAWRSATGCDTPGEVERLTDDLRVALEELDEPRAGSADRAQLTWLLNEHREARIKAESEVARLTARAERAEAEVARWRSAIGCDTPEGAKALLGSLLRRDAVAVRAEAKLAEWIVDLTTAAKVACKGPHDTDAGALSSAARRLEGDYHVGGSNVRAACSRVLRFAVDVLRATEGVSTPETNGERS